MDNHVRLLVVPREEDSLARGVGLTTMVYTQYLNRKERIQAFALSVTPAA